MRPRRTELDVVNLSPWKVADGPTHQGDIAMRSQIQVRLHRNFGGSWEIDD